MPSAKKPVETKTATEVVKEPETAVPEVKKAVPRGKSVKVQPDPVVEVKKEEVVSTEVTPTEEKESENLVQVLVDKISSLTTLNKEIQVVLKQVARDYDKLKKIVDKIQKKRENARKSPSGFAKPNKISDELCDFIGVPRGTEKSRTDITRYINTYVKEHNLNKPTNRRVILPDEKLKAILNVKEGEEVTFFILQRLISHHFPPKTVK
jgi:chromatin remodeling complex protein RSC6